MDEQRSPQRTIQPWRAPPEIRFGGSSPMQGTWIPLHQAPEVRISRFHPAFRSFTTSSPQIRFRIIAPGGEPRQRIRLPARRRLADTDDCLEFRATQMNEDSLYARTYN